MLSKIRQYLTRDTALQIYKTKVMPYFDYGDILYMGTHKETTTKLQRLQNRALKICTLVEPRYATDRLHFETKISMLEQRRTAHLRNFMFKRKDNIDYVDMRETGTRQRDAIIMKTIKANLKVFENSVYYKGAKEWNDLPINVRKSASYESFKASQKKWLMGTIRKPE